jgi:hypothetical protein
MNFVVAATIFRDCRWLNKGLLNRLHDYQTFNLTE